MTLALRTLTTLGSARAFSAMQIQGEVHRLGLRERQLTQLNAHKTWKPTLIGLFATAGFALAAMTGPAAAQSFSVTSLVTDNQAYLTSQGYSAAVTVDPNLINPWGMDHAPGGPWFIGNTGTEATMSGSSNGTFYTGAGVKVGSNVSIPEGAVPPNGPTGVVYNSSASGFSLPGGGHSQFFVASLDGTISGVGAGGSSASQVAAGQTPPVGPPHSIYTGLTMGNDGGASYLYAANNATGQVDVYNSSFQQSRLQATLQTRQRLRMDWPPTTSKTWMAKSG